MEKDKTQDGCPDSSEYQTFGYAILDSDLLRQREYTDLLSPNPIKDAGTSDSHRRSTTLKANFDIPKSDVPDTKEIRDKNTRQTKIVSESAKLRRPITLKANLNTTRSNVSDTKKIRDKNTRQKGKVSESVKPRRSVALQANLDSATLDIPVTKKIRSKKTRQKDKIGKPIANKKASVEAKSTAKTSAFHKTPAPLRSPVENPSVNPLDLCFSWAKRRQRLLMVVCLSFVSGVLFHGWLVPDESPVPSQTTDSGQAAAQSVPERTDYGTQPLPNSGYASNPYSPSTPAISGYPPEHRVYRNPNYGSTWPQQRPSSQTPNYGWSDYGHQTSPRIPSTTPWHESVDQTNTSYPQRTRQKYAPWSHQFQQYPLE